MNSLKRTVATLLLLAIMIVSFASCTLGSESHEPITSVTFLSNEGNSFKFTLTHTDGSASEIELVTDGDKSASGRVSGDSGCTHSYGSWFFAKNREGLDESQSFSFRVCKNCDSFEWQLTVREVIIDVKLYEDGIGWKSTSGANVIDPPYWEPGYIVTALFKLENVSVLAYEWKASLLPESEVSILADVIDVYVCLSDVELTPPTDRAIPGYTRLGTLREFLNSDSDSLCGVLSPGEYEYMGIALKMQESAGNEYQGVKLCPLGIQIIETLVSAENDSFANQYDQ